MAKSAGRLPHKQTDTSAETPVRRKKRETTFTAPAEKQREERLSESGPPLPERAGGAAAFSRLARMETLILLAMIVAAILRFARLGDVPPGLNQDEAVSGYDAYSLLLTGRDHLGHPFNLAGLESFGDWVSPMLTFLTIPAVALFGLKVETLRGVSAAVGVLAVPLIAWLAIELFGRPALGVVAAWLIAISPWHVHLSRWAIPPVMVPTMVIATLLAFVWAIKRLSGRGLVIAGVVAGLTVASYPTMKLYVPLLLLAVAIVYWRALLRFRRADLAYAALAFLLITWSIYYLSLRDPGGRARLEIVSVFRNRSQAVGAGLLVKQYLSYFSTDFLFVKGDGDTMHTPAGFGVEIRALAPLLLIGLLCLGYAVALPALRRRGTAWLAWLRPQSAALLLLALLFYPIPGSLTVPSPHTLRGSNLIPLIALLGALGTITTADALCRFFAGRQTAIAQGLIAVVLLAPGGPELAARYRYYFTVYPTTVAWNFQYGLLQAFDYAAAREQNYDEIWVSDANQAYIYLLFARRWPPSKVHTDLKLWRPPPFGNQIAEFGKYHFGTPSGFDRNALPIVDTIRASNGTVVLQIRAGEVNRKRILLVRRP